MGKATRLKRFNNLARATVAAVTIGLVGALGAQPAWAGALIPERGGSPNADRIASLYTLVLVIAAVIFVAVIGAMLWALWRYSDKRNPIASQIRGHTRLELSWTVAATLIIVFLAVFSLIKLPAIEHPDRAAAAPAAVEAGVIPNANDSLHIEVIGRQYIWMYRYPGGAYSYGEMVAPVGVTVELDIKSVDVAHSWWIPKLGGKFDAIPGYTSHTWFRLNAPGLYKGQCAELCGRNHANMLAQVRGVSPAEYAAWTKRQQQLIADAQAKRS